MQKTKNKPLTHSITPILFILLTLVTLSAITRTQNVKKEDDDYCYLAKLTRFETSGDKTSNNPYYLTEEMKKSIKQRGNSTPEKNMKNYRNDHKPIICPSIFVFPNPQKGSTRASFAQLLDAQKLQNPICCSKLELESLKTRWDSTKQDTYVNRAKGWARLVRKSIENYSKFYTAANDILKKPSIKLDCKMAAEEVLKYSISSTEKKKYKITSLWKQWTRSAGECYNFTFKAKLGLYCGIC